jgi:flagellar biosynthesis protein FliQ
VYVCVGGGGGACVGTWVCMCVCARTAGRACTVVLVCMVCGCVVGVYQLLRILCPQMLQFLPAIMPSFQPLTSADIIEAITRMFDFTQTPPRSALLLSSDACVFGSYAE